MCAQLKFDSKELYSNKEKEDLFLLYIGATVPVSFILKNDKLPPWVKLGSNTGQVSQPISCFSPIYTSVLSDNSTQKKMSVLERIYEHRKSAVAAQKKIPSQRPSDVQTAYNLNLAPPLVNFVERVRLSPFKLSLMAEIKRASPSKGVISLDTCAPAQARAYALAGASVISVLTEPEWFKGSIDDLRSVRQALVGMSHRPAVLQKDFIFDEYQILEARLAGADTVLLIVKMLDMETLTRLYKFSQSLNMEPLVEVNTIEEMKTAVELGKFESAEMDCLPQLTGQ